MADITKEDLRKEITAILKDADLTTMSAKKVRQQLEEKLDADLTDRKKEVDDLVMACLQEKQDGKSKNNKNKVNKSKDDDDDEEEEEEDEEEEEEDEEEEEEKPKPKRGAGPGPKKSAAKKAKKGSSDESEEGSDEDASDEEYSPSKKNKNAPAKKGKGGKKKKGSDSDTDEDWSKTRKSNSGGGAGGGGGGRKAAGGKKSGSGYTRAYTLSPELAAVVGADSMPRHEVVRKVWAIIKERNLYDPKNKQFAVCDDELLKVFGVKRFRTFGMMKYLKNHFIE